MELRNCPECGKLFLYTSKNLCPDCMKKEEEIFDRVRDYLYKNPNSPLEKVAEETEVDEKKILEFLKEGRLILKSGNPYILSCEICGAAILTGRYCENCARNLKKKLESAFQPVKSTREKTLSGRLHLSKIKDREK